MTHRIITSLAALLVTSLLVSAGNTLDLKEINSGKFPIEYIRTMTPMADGSSFAQIRQDGEQIVTYSYKTGKETGILFDVNKTQGEKIESFDNYVMSPDGKRLLIQTETEYIYRRSFKAKFYVYTIATKELTLLSAGGMQQTPVWSADGNQIAFVRDNNIFLVNLRLSGEGRETQVTHDGKRNEIINGIPDWVYEEEFGFNSAMVFNADGTHLCWIRFDESNVKTYTLQLFKGSRPEMEEYKDYPGEYSYKYPKAGFDNSTVSAWSYDIKMQQTKQIQLPLDKDGYIPRIKTTNEPDKILLYTMNRHQDELNIYAASPKTAACRLLVKENVEKYIKEDVLSNIQLTGKHLVMPSDRSGKMQLYLYDMNGKLLKQITNGKQIVTDLYGYDEKTGNTYYQAIGIDPMNREVYMTDKGGKTVCLTPRKGTNSATFSNDYKYFVLTWSDAETPYQFAICNNAGKQLQQLIDNKPLREQLSSYNLPQKEFFTFKTSEGVQLNGVMLKPIDFDASKKYPVIMYQYSGPGSQQVVNSWGIGSMGQGGLYDQYLTQRGFIVVCVDGRGTGGRGAEFEKCTYLMLGDLESKDQVETALYLGTLPYVDKDNIGIWGWSYGGFCTLMSMSEGRGVFKAGAAVAPPTNWKFYDSVYTERFMRTPQENPTGYDTNPIQRAEKLHGALLLCHGMSDDNVHPQNSFEYSATLVQQDKDFRELWYTNRNHSIRGGNSRNHLLRQIADFFVKELKGN